MIIWYSFDRFLTFQRANNARISSQFTNLKKKTLEMIFFTIFQLNGSKKPSPFQTQSKVLYRGNAQCYLITAQMENIFN